MCRFESTVQISKLQDLVNRSKLARCRGRFVCPVILYNGKVLLLCRNIKWKWDPVGLHKNVGAVSPLLWVGTGGQKINSGLWALNRHAVMLT